MAADLPPYQGNPETIGVEPAFSFEGTAVVPPPGTYPPARLPGKERTPVPTGVVPGWEFVQLDGVAVVPPPGTYPPPRPPGRERPHVPPQPPGAVDVLVARIETALQTIHAALAEIKQIQNKAG